MSTTGKIRLVLVTVMLAAPLLYQTDRVVSIGPRGTVIQDTSLLVSSSLLVGLFLWGLANAVLSTPGTLWLRMISVASCLAAFRWPVDAPQPVALVALIIWPPAFGISWALASPANGGPLAQRRARAVVAAIIGGVAIASLTYRVLFAAHLQQTGALFVGIPAILALVATFAPTPRTAAGAACQAVTVGLLVSLLVLQEGFLCVAMSAPLFYAVALAVAGAVQGRKRGAGSTTYSMLALLAIGPMTLEGVTPATTISRDETVSATKLVHATPAQIEAALVRPPRLERALPSYLRLGFPRPIATRIDMNAAPPRWTIDVRGGEMRLNGMEPRTGTLTLLLEESRPGYVAWRVVSDTSHMTHFLTWQHVLVEWAPVTPDTSAVRWTLQYKRGLDPAWYFGPMERYASRLAAGYLIDAVATP